MSARRVRRGGLPRARSGGSPRARNGYVGCWAALALGLGCLLSSASGRASSADAGWGGSPSPGRTPDAGAPSAQPERQPSGLKGEVTALNLSSGISENPAQGLFANDASIGFGSLVLALESLEKQPRVAGLLLRLGPGLSLAHAEELSALLWRLKAGRSIICHATQYSNASLLLSRACDESWVSPAGSVEAVGLAAQSVYLGGLLQRLGVQAQFLHMGRYKSAAEALTRTGPSEAARESLYGVLASVRETWLSGLSKGRRGAEVVAAAESGPWTPERALAQGLVDRVGYYDEARDRALELCGASKVEPLTARLESSAGAQAVARALRSLAGLSGSSTPAPVVVVPLSGQITVGSPGWSGDGIAASRWLPVLRRLRKDEAVKAVVLRINSPGGSALASDQLWHAIMRLRKAKPVVASLGAVAASGGYYLASAAHEVVSDRTTWLGSIGVVGGKIVVADALSKLGVHATTVGANPAPGANVRAAYLSPLTPWDEATQERVQEQLRSVYDLFVARVAEGRSMPQGTVRSVAEGRIWSGTQGLERHLVDRHGGLLDAVALARSRADLAPRARVRIEQGPDPLLRALGLEQTAASAWLPRGVRNWAALHWGPLGSSVDARVRSLLIASGLAVGSRLEPTRVALSAALVPLLEGEVALAVTPLSLLQP